MAKNILRGSRVRRSSKRANDFISSIGFDAPIAKHVVSINMAHMLSLLSVEGGQRRSGRLSVLEVPGAAYRRSSKLDESTEDVHHMIEQEAIKAIGMESRRAT